MAFLTITLGSYLQELPSYLRLPTMNFSTNRKNRLFDHCDIPKEFFKGTKPDDFHFLLKDFCFYQGYSRRKKNLTWNWNFSDSLVIKFIPATSKSFIQQRGFRSRSAPKVIGSKKSSEHVKNSLLDKIFPQIKLFSLKKRERTVTKTINQRSTALWNSYEDGAKAVPEDKQKSYTEGFIRGVASGRDQDSKSKFRIILDTVPTLLLIYILLLFFQKSFSAGVEIKPENITITFDDVKGMDDAKKEVQEIVDFLRDSKKYQKIGGRLPKGILLVGPPGTGKTLLARAIAGEAKVPFFRTSGSEFDEMFVGLGAKRVRELFEKAKRRTPCIIFIDEIDSVGSKRVIDNIHPYANQTINQLLAEMDGFASGEGIVVIGATNRVDDLDEALLRPGRFDLRTNIGPPDLAGRKDIFNLYLGKIIHDTSIDVNLLAKTTTSFTGADIENVVNQAALKAAIEGSPMVQMHHLEEARNRLIMGPPRASGRLPDEETNRITAYHEAGHAIIGLFTNEAVSLHQVTIIQRGEALGFTSFMPEKDEYHFTRAQMLAELDVMMGGRVAEEITFGANNITSGAASDFKDATILATNMVKKFGMSEKVGVRDFTLKEGSSLAPIDPVSQKTRELIDQEINRILQESYARTKDLLVKHKKEHQLLAEALLEFETLSGNEVKELVETGRISKRKWPS